jgi:hypothetical protein
MGQAAVDLPNSVEQAPAPLAGADDLLSQMAGAEIDRLLAEAGADAPAPLNGAAASSAPTASGALIEVPQDPARAAASKIDEDAYAAELEAVFKQMEATPATANTTADTAPAEVATVPVEQATTAAEFAALAQTAPALEALLPHADEKPSLLVRLLELLNAPFSFCPDSVRDLLGKIAILTLMNAIGVLLYLFLFKR